jgi:hypothetical protein
MKEFNIPPGEIIYKQNVIDDRIFILLEGSLEIYLEPKFYNDKSKNN